jgi:hypothetical protein
LALDLGEERDSAIQVVIVEVAELFKLLARREWLEWGGELLFSELRNKVEQEEQVATEVKAWAEAEAAKAKHLEEKEHVHQDAANAKVGKLEEWKAALVEARKTVLAAFHAKSISKEDLQ